MFCAVPSPITWRPADDIASKAPVPPHRSTTWRAAHESHWRRRSGRRKQSASTQGGLRGHRFRLGAKRVGVRTESAKEGRHVSRWQPLERRFPRVNARRDGSGQDLSHLQPLRRPQLHTRPALCSLPATGQTAPTRADREQSRDSGWCRRSPPASATPTMTRRNHERTPLEPPIQLRNVRFGGRSEGLIEGQA